MNILFSANTYFPQKGGAEQLVHDLIHYCQSKGHKTTLITQLLDKCHPEKEKVGDLCIHRVLFPRRHLFGKKGKRKNIKRVINLFFYHYKLLKNEKIDLIYISHFGMNGLFPILLRPFFKFKLIILLHSGEIRNHYHKHPIFRFVLRRGLSISDEIICVSRLLKKELLYVMPSISDKVSVVTNGVPTMEIQNSNAFHHHSPYMLYVGRLDRHKNIHFLLKSFANISSQVPTWNLILIGSGSIEDELKAYAKELGIFERVVFFGMRERVEIFSIIKGSNFAVLPSRSEGFPLVVLEYLSANKICIGSDVAGINEIIKHEETGVLFSPGDVEALSSAMLRCINDQEFVKRIEDNISKVDLSFYDTEAMFKNHMSLMQKRDYLSVIMPCKDAEVSMMKEAVFSVLRQSDPDWKLIVVNDRSSDPSCLKYLEELRGSKDSRIEVIDNQSNNFAGALNTGLRKTQSEFLAMLHCDDLLDLEAVKTIKKYIKEFPDVDYFHSSRRVIDDNGSFLSEIKKSKEEITKEDFITKSPIKHLHIFKVDKSLSIGGVDEALSGYAVDDYDFPWSMWDSQANFKAISECLYYYRDHRAHERLTTHVPLEDLHAQLTRIFKKHGLSEQQIQEQLALRTESYLKQSLFDNVADKLEKEKIGYDATKGWRESYN